MTASTWQCPCCGADHLAVLNRWPFRQDRGWISQQLQIFVPDAQEDLLDGYITAYSAATRLAAVKGVAPDRLPAIGRREANLWLLAQAEHQRQVLGLLAGSSVEGKVAEGTLLEGAAA